MSTHDDDDEFVTVRLPKRTADLMNVSLEVSTSPTALRGQVALFSAFGFLLGLAGIWGIIYSFSDPGNDFSRFVDVGMGAGALLLGIIFFFGAQTYRKAFKAKGLI